MTTSGRRDNKSYLNPGIIVAAVCGTGKAMDIEQAVLEKLRELPRAKQQEVLDFIEFISQNIQAPVSTGKHNWQEEPFVGLWEDREELRDSTAWVRSTRQQEWQS